ncbi:MAG: ABC transporter permease [Desulfobacterales bacterium]|nr:ABC transporter permease [Desulfobacterales bacterium]
MLAFKPVILWTDALIFAVVATAAVFAVYACRREHLRVPWRQVTRSRLSMSALVVLTAYGAVALFDSVHFRLPLPPDHRGRAQYSAEVLSVFDLMVRPLRTRMEKTYSAPFATHLYAKETVQLSDGTSVRIFPRLEYGGAHLKDTAREQTGDILRQTVIGLMTGVLAWVIIALGITAWLARRWREPYVAALARVAGARCDLPWHVVLMTAGVLIVLIAWLMALAPRYHVLGTDKVGQDVLYQALKSIRTGLAIGTLTTLVMLPFAVLLGIMAGFFKGWVDDAVQYLYTTLNSIPGVLLIAAAVLMLQVYIDTHPELFQTQQERADLRLLFLCIILGVTSWTGLCRLLRGESLKLSTADYIQAATALGVRHSRIIIRHLLPNVMHVVLIVLVLDFSGLVLAEAVLSYVGVGVDPVMNSWGNMINAARLEMAREPMVWWSLTAAFIFMFILVLAANVFADAVRDAFDPRLRRQ